MDSPDHLGLTVDGVVFEVGLDPEHPGTWHYTRMTGPHPGQYGFTSARSDGGRPTLQDHEDRIRSFLAMLDPETGYIPDQP